jgi:hypothetical protein
MEMLLLKNYFNWNNQAIFNFVVEIFKAIAVARMYGSFLNCCRVKILIRANVKFQKLILGSECHFLS